MVLDSLPYGGDSDGTLPHDPDQWLHSVPMQDLLDREANAAKLAHNQEAPGGSEASLSGLLSFLMQKCL